MKPGLMIFEDLGGRLRTCHSLVKIGERQSEMYSIHNFVKFHLAKTVSPFKTYTVKPS